MSTYQDEVAARQNAERTLLRDTLEGIAGELDGWRVEYPENWRGNLVRDDGVTLYARLETYGSKTGKLTLTAGSPDGANYSAGDYGRDKRPEISVSPSRGAETVARDVARRLIPAAVEYWQAVSARMARRLAALSARERFARELAGIMGTVAREWRDEWRADVPSVETVPHGGTLEGFRTLYGELIPDYDGQSVRAEVRNMTPEQARELAGLLAGWRK